MITKMSGSTGSVLGFKLIGDVIKKDFKILVLEVQALVDKKDQFPYFSI